MAKGRFTHGLFSRDKRLHSRWASMMSRCYRESDGEYSRYGGAGIVVCSEWHEYPAFFDWAIANGWNGLTLDRIDSKGNYEPSNCRWATHKEQARNRSNNKLIEFQGATLCVAAWAEKLSIPFRTLQKRFQQGWSPEKALTRPVGRWIGD